MPLAARRPAGAALVLLLGLAIRAMAPPSPWAARVWIAGLMVFGLPLAWRTVRGVAAGRFAADVVAALAILTALVLREPFAGLVIVLMQSGGEALEAWAAGRASAAVAALEAAAPRVAHRIGADGQPHDLPVADVRVDDRLLLRPGETIPCDGIVEDGAGEVNEAQLTGEPWPRSVVPGARVASGMLTGHAPLVLRVTARAADSQYAQLVELVRDAEGSKAAMQRLADRWAVWFTPFTITLAAGSGLWAHDPLRGLAVLVVATPCPMLLAVPVAIVAGINRAARHGVIVRRGEALERLATVDTLITDKTGTLTEGRPVLLAAEPAEGVTAAELLAVAAAIEAGSGHVLARSVTLAAAAAGVSPRLASGVREVAGRGVEGIVDGRLARVGSARWLAEGTSHPMSFPPDQADEMQAWVLHGDQRLGRLRFTDRVRLGAADALTALRDLGITQQTLASGDDGPTVQSVARQVGLTDARGDLQPADKVALVRAAQADGRRVLMLGDGTNDAPALAAADAGLAVAADGGGLGAASADAVLLNGDLRQVVAAVRIARRTLDVARQSLGLGLGLSVVGMLVAAAGGLTPVAGALVQEAIDVASILNALRAARAPTGETDR